VPAAQPEQLNFDDMGSGEMVSYRSWNFPHDGPVTNQRQQFALPDFSNPRYSENPLQDFDFDSFLHDGDGDMGSFDFNPANLGMDAPGEIGAE
jgi:hypothetical protein